MQIFSSVTPGTPLPVSPRAVALGLFDGVHLGHRRVIMDTVGVEGAFSCVFTFGADAAALKCGAYALSLSSQQENLFASLGVQEWVRADFSSYRDQTPQSFVRDTLCGQLHAVRVCCGKDFRFGKDKRGDVALLSALCEEYGITLSVTDDVTLAGSPVSSDRIRRLLEEGQVRPASRLLGHPFAFELPVSHGRRLGRQLGFPTLNQVIPEGFILPRFGVYQSCVTLDGVTYTGVSNVGVRPTVGGKIPLCETWLEDFDGDLYGRTVTVVLTDFVRGERPFPSVAALKDQMESDVREIRCRRSRREIRAVLFDFDDTLQNRRIAFQRYADFFLDRYAPEFSHEERAEAKEKMTSLNNGGYVDYLVYFRDISQLLGISCPPGPETLFAEYQMVFPRCAALFEDALPTLARLREQGLLLGVVTNGPTVQQHRKLDFSGVRPYLDLAMVSLEEGVGKPEEEIFRRAAARLGVSPEQCVFVGDHPQNDVAGAGNAGMHPVFMASRMDSCGDTEIPVIHSLSELPGVLERMSP